MRLLFLIGCFISCGISAQVIHDPVPEKMKARLERDSVDHLDEYYYRINHVKQVTETGKDYKRVSQIDRYGRETSAIDWDEGELSSIDTFIYSGFGNLIQHRSTNYFEGEVAQVVLYTYVYETIDSGRYERCVRQEEVSTKLESDGSKTKITIITRFEYDSAGHQVLSVESGERDYCAGGIKPYKTVITSIYASNGLEVERHIKNTGGCSGDNSTKVLYTYSDAGVLLGYVSYQDGEQESKTTQEHNQAGQLTEWTVWKDGKVLMQSTDRYYKNGLTKISKFTFFGSTDTSRYSYEFY